MLTLVVWSVVEVKLVISNDNFNSVWLGYRWRYYTLCDNIRLHQPVLNSISDNSNILWNRPSLGINSRQGYLTFPKTTIVYHLKEKK